MNFRGVFVKIFVAVLLHVNLIQGETSSFPKLYLQLVDWKNASNLINFAIDEASYISKNEYYRADKPTVIYSHGYSESIDGWTVQAIVNAYVKNEGYNLILVDYGAYSIDRTTNIPSPEDYLNTIANIKAIAPIVADALWQSFDDKIRDFELIGHSLGAHLSAYINRELKKVSNNYDHRSIPVITALDPAAPFFFPLDTYGEVNFPLNGTDADIVHVIHTDTAAFGAPINIGTVDIYPNNGFQPGCSPIDTENLLTNYSNFCSHQRSVSYFAEGISNRKRTFQALKCDSWDNFVSGACKHNRVALLGESLKKNLEGTFYLQTNSEAPFSRGKKGLVYDSSI